jgi:hypothetical protein
MYRNVQMPRLHAVVGVCFIAVSFSPFRADAQEVECAIQVTYEAVATTHKELLRDFAADITNYINSHKWGPDDLGEKIKCTMNVFIQSAVGQNRYVAQVFIGSQRRINKSERSSAVVRLFDDFWEFTYIQNRPINHNPQSFNDLTSFLDFYIFLIIGYDYDTYENLLGTQFFQKASEVANIARSSGARGWEQKTGSFNRMQLIDEILNPRFTPVRTALHTYHSAGLDVWSSDSAKAFNNILRAVESIGKTRKQVNPRNLFIKTFFETKYLELADLFSTYPDPSVYRKLWTVDPVHQQTYEEYLKKRK